MNAEQRYLDLVLSSGAQNAAFLPAPETVLDRSFRDTCARNACGVYGKCWVCPPDVGEIDELMASLRQYRTLLLYQTVGVLEDSFDFENMLRYRKEMAALSQKIKKAWAEHHFPNALFLSTGGCGVCDVCAKREGAPCRFPESAMPSLEAYGVFVSATAQKAGLKYHNGQNTVTYFGGIFF